MIMNDHMTDPEAQSLADCVSQAIQEYLRRSNAYESSLALEGLIDPVLTIEGILSDGQAHPERSPRRIELVGLLIPAVNLSKHVATWRF